MNQFASRNRQHCSLSGSGAVPRAKAACARVVIINADPTPFDDIADAVIQQRIGDVLPRCGMNRSSRHFRYRSVKHPN